MTKFLGKMRFTKEFLETLMGIPEETEITGFSWDASREILQVVVKSDSEVEGYTSAVEEGQEIPNADHDEVITGIDMSATGRVFGLTIDDLLQFPEEEEEPHVEV